MFGVDNKHLRKTQNAKIVIVIKILLTIKIPNFANFRS